MSLQGKHTVSDCLELFSRQICYNILMGWQNIGNFLDRFQVLKPPKKFVQGETAKAVSAVLGAPIKEEAIEERSGVVYIKTRNQAIKNNIFMRKEDILNELSKTLGKKIKDIRF